MSEISKEDISVLLELFSKKDDKSKESDVNKHLSNVKEAFSYINNLYELSDKVFSSDGAKKIDVKLQLVSHNLLLCKLLLEEIKRMEENTWKYFN